MRPGQPTPLRAWRTYDTILSAFGFLEYWDLRYLVALSGSSIISWTGRKLGWAVIPSGVPARPTFAVDGSFWTGLPVIQTTKSGSKYLQYQHGSKFWATTDNPCIIWVGRVATSVASDGLFCVGDGVTARLLIEEVNINQVNGRAVMSASQPARLHVDDLLPHVRVAGLTATQLQTYDDGVAGTPVAKSDVFSTGIDRVSFGAKPSTAGPADAMHAMGFLCTSMPTAAAITELTGLVRAELGF